MTKQEFIQKVAHKSGLSNRDAGKAVDAFLESVTDSMKASTAFPASRFDRPLL